MPRRCCNGRWGQIGISSADLRPSGMHTPSYESVPLRYVPRPSLRAAVSGSASLHTCSWTSNVPAPPCMAFGLMQDVTIARAYSAPDLAFRRCSSGVPLAQVGPSREAEVGSGHRT